jgi:RNA ligase
MKYEFPIIADVEQVRAAVKGRPEFIEAVRDHYTIFNYVVSLPDTFPPVNSEEEAILRECRGIAFCNYTGKVLNRKFHKFFNLAEREETRPENVDFSKPHKIIEKLDGSMITPIIIDNELQWHTKMGKTEIADQAAAWVAEHPNYAEFAVDLLCIGDLTPIFEWCSRDNQVVIEHETPRLVLLAARSNFNGKYAPRENLEVFARVYNIDLVKEFDYSDLSNEQICELVRQWTDAEGIVISFDDGHKIKVKADWYVQLHRTKEKIKSERHIISLICENLVDDLLPALQEADKEMVLRYQHEFNKMANDWTQNLTRVISAAQTKRLTRKEFALDVVSEFPPIIQSVLYKCFEVGYDELQFTVFKELIGLMARNSAHTRNFEKLKTQLFPRLVYARKEILDV